MTLAEIVIAVGTLEVLALVLVLTAMVGRGKRTSLGLEARTGREEAVEREAA